MLSFLISLTTIANLKCIEKLKISICILQRSTYLSKPISLLLMTWRRKEPRHQWQWYLLSLPIMTRALHNKGHDVACYNVIVTYSHYHIPGMARRFFTLGSRWVWWTRSHCCWTIKNVGAQAGHRKQVSPFGSFVMMTSSNGNIFRDTGHLCGEFTGPRWIPCIKASDAERWCFLWSAPE